MLAVATFSAVRSANRSARIAERSFEIGLRPILAPSRLEDPPQKVMFHDRHWVVLEGGRAVVEVVDGVVYLAMLVRNVGSGMAIIDVGALPRAEVVQRPLGGYRGLPTADQGPVDRSRRCRLLAGGDARRDRPSCRRPWPRCDGGRAHRGPALPRPRRWAADRESILPHPPRGRSAGDTGRMGSGRWTGARASPPGRSGGCLSRGTATSRRHDRPREWPRGGTRPCGPGWTGSAGPLLRDQPGATVG